MYFWKTKELSSQIKNNGLTETNKKNYYIASAVFTIISMYSAFALPQIDMSILAFEAVLMLIVTIIGINITFNSNGGDSGIDYISRMVILSLPVLIKLIVLLIAVGIVIQMVLIDDAFSESVEAVINIFAQIIFFWRINLAIKFINA